MSGGGTVSNLPSETIRADGKKIWLSMNCMAITDASGQINHFEGMVKDVTLQRLAEAKAEERRHQLQQADKLAAVGAMVAGVAHEINNPTGVVMLNTPILAKAWKGAAPALEEHFARNKDFKLGGLPYPQMREEIPLLFSEVEDAAVRIKRIVNDLKDFSRLDARDHMELVDINTVVKTAIRLTHHKIKRATNNFHTEFNPEIPPVTGNFQKLEQVIINLIINACQALRDSSAALRITTSSDQDRQRVIITVQDEGGGMDAETLSQIMDPFFTTKRDTGGTGLGLSVSAGIVKEHGGELIYDSAPESGTIATLRLPAAKM